MCDVCRVEVWLDPGESLGISIVGGRSVIKRLKNGEELKGIFIKQVLPDSPAGRTLALKTGDKILQVSNTLLHLHTRIQTHIDCIYTSYFCDVAVIQNNCRKCLRYTCVQL